MGAVAEGPSQPTKVQLGKYVPCMVIQRVMQGIDKVASQIGGSLLLVQYWAWARFPYLCPTVKRGPPVGAYSPPIRGPLSLK